MSTGKNNLKGNNNDQRKKKQESCIRSSPDDGNDDRKMPALASLPNSPNTSLDLNQHDDRISGVASLDALNDPLGKARALMKRQQDSVNQTVARIAEQQLAAQREQLRIDLVRNYLEDAQKETIYRGALARDSAFVAPPVATTSAAQLDEASFRLGLTRRKRPLEEDVLLAEREHNILKQARREEEFILMNKIRREEMLANARRKRGDEVLLNSLLSRPSFNSLCLSRLNPNDTLSRIAMYNKEPSLFPFGSQSSGFPPIFTGSASPHNTGINPSNDATFTLNALGGLVPQGNQSLSSLYNYHKGAHTSTLTGNNNLSNILTSVPKGMASHPTTTSTPSRTDLLRLSAFGAFTGNSSHQHIANQVDSRETGIDLLAGDNGEIDHRADQKRFNKHQCKQWTVKYQELLDFKKREGHCNVPHLYKENRGLAMWVKRQRHQHNLLAENKPSTLTNERIRLLESIGFVWNCLDSAWDKNFEDLRIFAHFNGHCSVPPTYHKNPKLASWVITQRRQCKLLEDGKQSSMTQKRFEKLQQIGFPVFTKKHKKPPSIP